MGIEESGPRLEQDWRTVGPEAPTRLLPPVLDLDTYSGGAGPQTYPRHSLLRRESVRMREKAPSLRETLSRRKQEVGELVPATAPEPENLPDTSRALELCPPPLKWHRHGQWLSSSHPRRCPFPGSPSAGRGGPDYFLTLPPFVGSSLETQTRGTGSHQQPTYIYEQHMH